MRRITYQTVYWITIQRVEFKNLRIIPIRPKKDLVMQHPG